MQEACNFGKINLLHKPEALTTTDFEGQGHMFESSQIKSVSLDFILLVK